MSKLLNMEKASYLLLFGGVLLDHITTIIGINYYNLYETNPVVNNLINAKLWGLIDLALCLIFVFVLRKIFEKNSSLKVMLVLPLFSGIFRMLVGISNLLLIL